MNRLHAILSALAVIVVAIAAPIGCGGEDGDPGGAEGRPAAEGAQTTDRNTPAEPEEGDRGTPPSEKPPGGESGPAEDPSHDLRVTALEREAADTVRSYIRALDRSDGERVCALLAPGVIEKVELPILLRGCAESLEASIGYRDPRGLPVWKGAKLLEIASARIQGSRATVVATVHTTFADRTEPSIEDDVVYLERAGGRWLIAKPSATLFRAIGVADIPPVVLSPPRERS